VSAIDGRGVRVVAVAVAVAFGIATLASGGRVLFGGEAARQAAGAVVPWVLWFNFAAGFAYVAAGVGLGLRRGWAAPLALAIALACAVVLAALGVDGPGVVGVARGGDAGHQRLTAGGVSVAAVGH
jgi:hypothetical protein